MKWFTLGLVFLLLILATGCTAGPNPMVDTADEEGQVAGVWQGLWHGIIAPVTFVISIFDPTVHMYAVHNNGKWYNFGFLLGMAVCFGSLGGGTFSRRWRR